MHVRYYPVTRIHQDTLKKEVEHLVKLGVLSYQGSGELGKSLLHNSKKKKKIRWISDLRALNKCIKRKQYPLPIIQDILRKREGYEFFTKVDISMQYSAFELGDESKELCTLVTPFSKYNKYNRLPMGLKCSPDIAQEVMENI